LIFGSARTRAALGPTPGDLVLLPDARFVGEPDFYCGRIDVLFARDLVQTGCKVFLYSSMAALAPQGSNGAKDEFLLAATAQNLGRLARLRPTLSSAPDRPS
jgi:hypothetical protein